MDRSRDYEYYRRRARDERHKASICEDNAVALAHFRMADAYDRRILDLEMGELNGPSSAGRR
ncbi:hypothetical protein [Sphingomonas sp. MS122]|uniref:hypothetical protein n=1 Tax=Sphingomonas sp. MS122 TaxID=3412683 RepID=UPI003C2E2AB6